MGKIPVRKLATEILSTIENAPSIPKFLVERLEFSQSDYYSFRAHQTLPQGHHLPLSAWKPKGLWGTSALPQFLCSIHFGTHTFNTTPTGPIEVAWIPRLTPKTLAKAKTLAMHEDSLENYRKNCDECWLLVHPKHMLAPGPSLPDTFDIDVEAFESHPIDSTFDAVWIVAEDGQVVRAG